MLRRRIALIAALLCVGSLAIAAAPAPAASDPLAWSAPALIDSAPPFGAPGALLGMSCPSASLCVAVDNAGRIVSSTDPTGGAGAWTLAYAIEAVSLYGVSCPSTSLCVAVASSGDVLTSTDPT